MIILEQLEQFESLPIFQWEDLSVASKRNAINKYKTDFEEILQLDYEIEFDRIFLRDKYKIYHKIYKEHGVAIDYDCIYFDVDDNDIDKQHVIARFYLGVKDDPESIDYEYERFLEMKELIDEILTTQWRQFLLRISSDEYIESLLKKDKTIDFLEDGTPLI